MSSSTPNDGIVELKSDGSAREEVSITYTVAHGIEIDVPELIARELERSSVEREAGEPQLVLRLGVEIEHDAA